MKKFLSAPIILSGLVLSAFSLLGTEPIKAKVIDNYGGCKTVKTSAGKYVVKIRSSNKKLHKGTNKNSVVNWMYQSRTCARS